MDFEENRETSHEVSSSSVRKCAEIEQKRHTFPGADDQWILADLYSRTLPLHSASERHPVDSPISWYHPVTSAIDHYKFAPLTEFPEEILSLFPTETTQKSQFHTIKITFSTLYISGFCAVWIMICYKRKYVKFDLTWVAIINRLFMFLSFKC